MGELRIFRLIRIRPERPERELSALVCETTRICWPLNRRFLAEIGAIAGSDSMGRSPGRCFIWRRRPRAETRRHQDYRLTSQMRKFLLAIPSISH
jgi:hypothetical protein